MISGAKGSSNQYQSNPQTTTTLINLDLV